MNERVTHLRKALDRYVNKKGNLLSRQFTEKLRAVLSFEERQRLTEDLKSSGFDDISPDILFKIENDEQTRSLLERFRELLALIRKAGL